MESALLPYWHGSTYVRAICARVSSAADVLYAPGGYPLILSHPREGLTHLACAPGFLSPSSADDMAAVLGYAQDQKAVSGFFQFRGTEIDAVEAWLNKRYTGQFLIEARQGVHVCVDEDEEAMLSACRRDTRSRLRQVMQDGIHYETIYHPNFATYYAQIAEENGFSAVYRYSAGDIEAMSGAAGIMPVSCFDAAGVYLGGALLGRVDADLCDYIISAYRKDFPNAGRAVLWSSLQAARALGFARVHLGGGVVEGDALYDFKMSFGGQAVTFYTIKIIFDPDTYVAEYMDGAPDGAFDLTSRFPPA